jgi:hypothetical protein
MASQFPIGASFSPVCGFQCLEPSVYAGTITETYKPGKSAQRLWEKSTIIARSDNQSSVVALAAAGEVNRLRFKTVSLTSTSVDLVRSLTIVAVPTLNLGDSAERGRNQFLKITHVKFEGSGRTLVDCSATSATLLGLSHHDRACALRGSVTDEEGIHTSHVNGVANFAGTFASVDMPALPGGAQAIGWANDVDVTTDATAPLTLSSNIHTSMTPESNIFNYSFCQDPSDPTYYSQGLSLSGIASQKFTVTVQTRQAVDFTVLVISNAVYVKSISTDSGAILNSFSV